MVVAEEQEHIEVTETHETSPGGTGADYALDPEAPSRLLQYLPGMYSRSTDQEMQAVFLNGFLNLFDSYWQPFERQLDNLYAYFDPRLTPEEFLPWLGTWVDLVLDENWEPARRRELIARAAELYRWRGTAWALREHLKIYSGVEPEIAESPEEQNPFHFTVTLRVPEFDRSDPELARRMQHTFDSERIRRIVDQEKPAHTTYSLVVQGLDG